MMCWSNFGIGSAVRKALNRPVSQRDVQGLLARGPGTEQQAKRYYETRPHINLDRAGSTYPRRLRNTRCPAVRKGPAGTIAYLVEVESSEPGARVEANNESVGKTPFTLKIFGDKDGTFHNFGNYHYTLTAYPVRAGQQPQTKDFRTGGWFTPEDRIPKKIFFDFGPAQVAPKPDSK